MTPPTSPLHDLAHAYGVSTSFENWKDDVVEVPDDAIVEVLAAMGVDASDPAAAIAAKTEAGWRRMLPPSHVVTRGDTASLTVHVPHGSTVTVDLHLESGSTRMLADPGTPREHRTVDGDVVDEVLIPLPADLPLGYHTVSAASTPPTETGEARTAETHTAETTLIVTPPWLGLPATLKDGSSWGFATQLYSVRSAQSWGVGDLTDLTDMAVWSASELGADYVLINPLHAAEPVVPLEPSPYLPSSRRFFNPLYLRIEDVSEYAWLDDQGRARIDGLAASVHERLDTADVIDRDTSWTAKREALQVLYAAPRRAGRELDFAAYCQRQGAGLRQFATWSVLAIHNGNDARVWPEGLRDATGLEVARFAAEHGSEIDFEMWLQWLLDEQLQRAQGKAVNAGMSLGIMHDLAVGVHPGGADVWRLRDAYATGMRVGAPPDAFNQLGQDWQQPPWRPDKLAELAYAPFRDLIANVLRHAGGVRIDHIIGLFRLWWVPAGRTPDQGTYVRYDHEAMIGVLALEAHRAGAVVVGEDLGVVEQSARDYLLERGILGTSILWFERDENGDPLPAEKWRELCLASVTTHDLPPNAGYLAGEHVKLRDRLGLLTRPVEEEAAADQAERASWLDEIRSRGLLADDASVTETITALHRYLALAPSRLLNIALTDAVGDRRTQNQPGTLDEYPNWRIPLSGPDGTPLRLEDVMASTSAAALATAMTAGRVVPTLGAQAAGSAASTAAAAGDPVEPRPEDAIADAARAVPDTTDHTAV
ncbi:4-alpha-glucanotransferase [Marisediminicola senii]|uniref:4-alpha-glucanotransferase n=1 Tax=Marisediminicola senii TaxID=2711233 RepID=UPI0013EAEE6D|nr:4-alpha-glucanotransferase [Marisediminicola senii]